MKFRCRATLPIGRSPGTLRGAGFTLMSLLCALVILFLNAWVLTRAMSSRSATESLTCLRNQRQLARAMQLYTDDNHDSFPAHRNQAANDNAARALTNWWGTTILPYAGDERLYRCPAIRGTRVDRGVRWKWQFTAHEVGYGYNGFFLGIHPYQPHGFTVGGVLINGMDLTNRHRIVNPAENILFADAQPFGNPPVWGSVLWWPNACMDARTSTSRAFEGVETLRHGGVAAVAFNDGHVEMRRDQNINPPVDPSSGNPKGLINLKFWDPLQRGK